MEGEPGFDFLSLRGKTFLVMGVANKKSVAYRIATIIQQSGGNVIYSVRSEARKQSLAKLLSGAPGIGLRRPASGPDRCAGQSLAS